MFSIILILLTVGTIPHSTAITHADTRVIVVSEACHMLIEPTHNAVVVSPVIPATGSAPQLERFPEKGVPSRGVISVGEVRVLLVSVSVPASVAISPSVMAVLNSAVVPVIPTILVWSPVFVPVIPSSLVSCASVMNLLFVLSV